jgi:glutamate-1-semialdehyde aminotransferase
LGQSLGVPLQVTGAWSIFGVHFADKPIKNVRDAQSDAAQRGDFALAMMTNGILWPAARIAGFLSSTHKEEHIIRLLKACRVAMETVFLHAATTR